MEIGILNVGMNGTNPIVVVTGGNRGIGFEICRQLVKRGAQILLTARKPDAGEQASRNSPHRICPRDFIR